MVYITNSVLETEALGQRLGAIVAPGSVVALFGGLGAGKTAFVRGLARGMGLDARVVSPTYTIVNEYGGDVPLFHFDLYRLSSGDELFDIGWEDYLRRGGVCAVEWSENADFDEGTIRVVMERLSEEIRQITIEGVKGL